MLSILIASDSNSQVYLYVFGMIPIASINLSKLQISIQNLKLQIVHTVFNHKMNKLLVHSKLLNKSVLSIINL